MSEVIYQGKVRKLGVLQNVKILHDVNKNNFDSVYTVVFGDKSKHKLIHNSQTGQWEEAKLGITSLSKKYGKLIDAWFD